MLITAMKTALIFVADLPLLNKSRRLLQDCGTWGSPESVGGMVALAADRGVTRNQLGLSLVSQLSSTVARRQPPSPPTLPR